MALPFRIRVLLISLQIVWTAYAVFKAAIAILKNPFRAFQKKARRIPPQVLLDPSLGRHEYITANGLRFHYVTAGDKTKPLMLLLHGFPEFWYSWRYQLKEFSEDYHVVAVDLRGYGESEKPDGVDKYTIQTLKEDVIDLIRVLGDGKKCVLVAHDWGGVIAWRVVHRHPELIERFIVLNCPHAKVFRKALSKGWGQLAKSWYVFLFQTPWLPEVFLSLRDYELFKEMYIGKETGLRNLDNFSDNTLEAFKYTFSQKGALTPPINYIRNMFNVDGSREKSTSSGKAVQLIDIPTLLIWGESDSFLDVSLVEGHGSVCSDLTVRRIPNCSHWVQQDCPELTNQYIREFVANK